MKRQNKMKWLLLVALFALLINCSVQPPNIYIFEEMNEHMGIDPITGHTILRPSPTCYTKIQELSCLHGVATMTGDEIFIGELPEHFFNGKPASQIKEESILMPADESYSPMVTYIINSCKALNCNSDVTRFKVKIESLKNIK